MEVSPDILSLILRPYRIKSADYLQQAWMNEDGSLRGDYHIKSPVHIQQTGHFNAVDAMIAGNQLAYTWFAERCIAGLEPINFEQFLEMQLECFVIANVECSFNRLMDQNRFSAVLTMLNQRRNAFKIRIDFRDVNGAQGATMKMLVFKKF